MSDQSTTFRHCIRLYVLALSLLPGIVVAETGQPPDDQAVSRGAQLYEQYCQACHKKDGVGEPPIPWSIRRSDYVVSMPLDASSHAWHHGDEQLVRTILEGNPRSRTRMPQWKNVISDADTLDLVAYIKSLWPPRILACQGPKHMQCM